MRFQKIKIISESSNFEKKCINILDMYEFGVKKTILETMLDEEFIKLTIKEFRCHHMNIIS